MPAQKFATRAGDHRDGQVRVLVQLVDRVGQALAHRQVHRIARFRPVDRDDKHAPVALRENFVRHPWPFTFRLIC
jgi:hypothetical protein